MTAGIVDNKAFEEVSEENPGALLILAETESVSRDQLVIARPGMDPALVEAVRTLLVGLDKTAEGQAVMEPSETRRFIELSEEAEAAIARIREMYELVQSK